MSDTIEGSVDTKPLEQVSDETGEEEESPNEKEKTVVEEDTKESAEPVVTPPNDEEEENVVPANKEEDVVPAEEVLTLRVCISEINIYYIKVLAGTVQYIILIIKLLLLSFSHL